MHWFISCPLYALISPWILSPWIDKFEGSIPGIFYHMYSIHTLNPYHIKNISNNIFTFLGDISDGFSVIIKSWKMILTILIILIIVIRNILGLGWVIFLQTMIFSALYVKQIVICHNNHLHIFVYFTFLNICCLCSRKKAQKLVQKKYKIGNKLGFIDS